LIEAALAEKKVQPARPDYEADLGATKTEKIADTGGAEGAEEGEEAERTSVVDDEEED
jgi:hypothetical protein